MRRIRGQEMRKRQLRVKVTLYRAWFLAWLPSDFCLILPWQLYRKGGLSSCSSFRLLNSRFKLSRLNMESKWLSKLKRCSCNKTSLMKMISSSRWMMTKYKMAILKMIRPNE